MQLLQEPGHSSSLNREQLLTEVEGIIRIAERAGEKIGGFLKEEAAIIYSGMGYPGAYVLKSYMQVLRWGNAPKLMNAGEFLFSFMPYSEGKIRAIYFMGSIRERSLALAVAEGVRVMGGEIIVVTPFPNDPIIRGKIGESSLVSVEGSRDPLLSEIIASAFAGMMSAEMSGRKEDMRIVRLRNELRSLAEVYPDIIEQSCPDLKKFSDERSKIDVLFSSSLSPPANLIWYKLVSMGKDSRLLEVDASLPIAEKLWPAIVLYTSVEEGGMKELLYRLRTMKNEGKMIRFNTDPLTAQIYASFLSRCFIQ